MADRVTSPILHNKSPMDSISLGNPDKNAPPELSNAEAPQKKGNHLEGASGGSE